MTTTRTKKPSSSSFREILLVRCFPGFLHHVSPSDVDVVDDDENGKMRKGPMKRLHFYRRLPDALPRLLRRLFSKKTRKKTKTAQKQESHQE
jgi:hypothetical protein